MSDPVHEPLDACGSAALRSALDAVPAGIVTFDRRGAFVAGNRGARELLGPLYGQALTAWLTSGRVFTAEGHAPSEDALGPLAALADGRTRAGEELRIVSASGRARALLVASRPTLDADGAVREVVCALADLEPYRHAERARAAQLRFEALGALVSGVAGPFNDAFTAIQGYAELLRTRLPHGHPACGALEEIGRAGDRAALLARRLLAHGRREVPSPQRVPLEPWLARCLPRVRARAGPDVTVVFQPSADGVEVEVDPGLLEQVLFELVDNAVAAMRGEGTLTLATEALPPDVSLGLARRAPEARAALAVTDTGHGIQEHERPRVFEPFFTTRPGALGLGLTTANRLVAEMGGELILSAPRRGGTTFRAVLPRAPARAEAAGAAPTSAHEPLPPATVLLVEDDPVVRDLIRELLAGRGLNVVEAASAEEAMRVVEAPRGGVDLLLTDVCLPGREGPELAEALRRHAPGLRVLLMSGCSDRERLAPLARDTHTAFVAKPFDAERLVTHVKALLATPS